MKSLSLAILTTVALPACGRLGMGTGDDDGTPDAVAPAADAGPSLPDGAPAPARWRVTLVAPPAGDAVVMPLGMDAETGDVVGYAGPEPWSPLSRPVRVIGGIATVLDVPDANYGFAWGASAEVTAGEYGWHGATWTAGERAQLPAPLGYNSSSAHAVDDTGLVVGSWADYDDPIPPNPTGPRPCTWRDGVVAPLPTFDAQHIVGAAWAAHRSGGIAGALVSPSGYVAVRWASPTAAPVVIGPIPGATLTEARGINANGDVVGRVSLGSTSRAFVARTGAEPVVLPTLPGGYAESYGIDDAGRVVGAASNGDGTAHAVIWIDDARRRSQRPRRQPARRGEPSLVRDRHRRARPHRRRGHDGRRRLLHRAPRSDLIGITAGRTARCRPSDPQAPRTARRTRPARRCARRRLRRRPASPRARRSPRARGR